MYKVIQANYLIVSIGNYEKITNWVLSGANVSDLSKFGIHPQIMRGFDGYQNVLMTGYYSPVLHARRSPQGQFQNPIYRMPVNKTFLAVRKSMPVH